MKKSHPVNLSMKQKSQKMLADRQSFIPDAVVASTWAVALISSFSQVFSPWALSTDSQSQAPILGSIFSVHQFFKWVFSLETYPLGSFCHYSAASEDVLCSKRNTFHLSQDSHKSHILYYTAWALESGQSPEPYFSAINETKTKFYSLACYQSKITKLA